MPALLPPRLDRLDAFYGKPKPPLPKSALDWILWENAAYLVPEERRKAAYLALKRETQLSARGILALKREKLQELAQLGGMMADLRVRKLVTIAELVRDDFDGDLQSALELPLSKARSALRKFPGIGAPGADKILLFTGTHALPCFESNGLRVLIRLGFVTEQKSYAASYKQAVAVFAAYVPKGAKWLMRAHQLLHLHGQTLCKNNGRCARNARSRTSVRPQSEFLQRKFQLVLPASPLLAVEVV